MNPRSPSFRAALAAALVAVVVACGSGPDAAGRPSRSESRAYDRADGPVIVLGTVLEASSGQAVTGAVIEGPGGVQARTDENGRFVLRGLEVGQEGELRASTADGRTATNRLRQLRPGELEVVLYLR